MKLGLALEATPIESVLAQAVAAEDVGIDIAWVDSDPRGESALAIAAGVAARTGVIRLAARVATGVHPLEIAEAVAVADNCSNGRLILVLEDVDGDADLLTETVDVVLSAIAPRPFRHKGVRWQIPGNLPENDQHEERIAVTPQVVQSELPVWLLGATAAGVGRSHALAHVSAEGQSLEQAAREWETTDERLGPARLRLRRPGLRSLDTDRSGGFDAGALVARLRADQLAWGMDTAVLHLPAGLEAGAWAHAAHRVAQRVRPSVMMHDLPPGIESHWKATLS
jgi:hypothetical protein